MPNSSLFSPCIDPARRLPTGPRKTVRTATFELLNAALQAALGAHGCVLQSSSKSCNARDHDVHHELAGARACRGSRRRDLRTGAAWAESRIRALEPKKCGGWAPDGLGFREIWTRLRRQQNGKNADPLGGPLINGQRQSILTTLRLGASPK